MGLLDIVVTAWQEFVSNVYMNRGGMRFKRARLQGDADPAFANQGLGLVDISGDGKPDIALSAFEYVAGAGGWSHLDSHQRVAAFRGEHRVYRARIRADDERFSRHERL